MNRTKTGIAATIALATLCFTGYANAQTTSQESTIQDDRPASPASDNSHAGKKPGTSAKHDVGSGSADIGKGAAKGAGSVAAGTGKAAGDLVTLHPVDAAADAGKGAVSGGKNVGVGAAKGTAKVLRGTGKAFKHIF
jgi:hypothetical protein